MSKTLPFPRRDVDREEVGFPQDLSDHELEDLGRKALIATSGGVLLWIFGSVIPPVGVLLSVVHYTSLTIGLLAGIPGALMTMALKKEWQRRHQSQTPDEKTEQG